MPKRIRPKYGYQSEYLLRARDRDFYIRVDIEKIAQEHKIDDVDGFERWANGAAHIFRLYRNNFDDMPRPKHVRAAVREIRELAAKLEDRLYRLDDVSLGFLWKPQMEVDQMAIQGAENSPYGHRITRWPCGEDTEIVDYIGQREITESITILKNYAVAAIAEVPPGRRGDQRNYALRIWMSNAYAFWTEKLDRQFTLTVHKGKGTTDAYLFCCDCLNGFASEMRPASIITAMRQTIQRKRKR